MGVGETIRQHEAMDTDWGGGGQVKKLHSAEASPV